MTSKFRQNLNTWGTIVFGGLLLFAGVKTVIERFGSDSPAFKAENLLEQALQPGVSDRQNFTSFKDKGGLEYESSWNGFKVRQLQTTYDEHSGKLGFVTIVLEKNWPSMKLASPDNLRSALSGACVKILTAENARSPENQSPVAGVTCTMQETERGAVVVTMVKQ